MIILNKNDITTKKTSENTSPNAWWTTETHNAIKYHKKNRIPKIKVTNYHWKRKNKTLKSINKRRNDWNDMHGHEDRQKIQIEKQDEIQTKQHKCNIQKLIWQSQADW